MIGIIVPIIQIKKLKHGEVKGFNPMSQNKEERGEARVFPLAYDVSQR